MLFPELPEAQMWMDWAVAATAYQMTNSIVDGVWIECPRYHEAATSWYVPFLAALQRRTDVDLTQHPNFKAMLDWFVRFSTMPLTITTNLPTIPAWGDSTYGNLYQVLGAAAPFYKNTDPEFSKRLMWMWRRGGAPYATGWDFATTRPQLLDPTLPDTPQSLRSEASPGKMGQVVMRSGSGDTNEILMFFKCGESSFAHQNPDQSHFDIFAYGLPLALDSCMDNYNSTPYPNDYYDDARGHNMIVFASSLADQWRNAHFSAFASTPLADYTVGDASSPNNPVNNSYNYRCRRHIVFVKAGYFVIWDEIDSSQTPQWQLHTPAQSLQWSAHEVSCVTPWGVNLDVHALLPTNNLVANETDQKFYRRGFFTWDTQKYFTINGTASGDFVNVLQPRRTNAPTLTATLLSANTNGVSVQVQLNGRTDLISLTVTGAVVTLGANPPLHFGIKGTPALMSGPGDLRKIGGTPEMIGEARTYTGSTLIEDGTLRLAPTRLLPAAAPIFWFDADNAATFEFDDSGKVLRWHSAVFDFGPAKQLNPAQRPARVSGALNSRATVDFGAYFGNTTNGDYMLFPTVRDVWSVFVVAKAGTQGILLGAERTEHFRRGSSGQIWHSSSSSSNVRNGVTRLNGAPVNGTTTTLPANSYSLVSLVAAGPTMADALGRWATFGSGGIQLAELIAYNRPLTAQEVTNVEAYLNYKWFNTGDATNLPALPIANLLPATTDLNLATTSAALDLNGVSQSVASLTAVPGSEVVLNGGSLTLTGVPVGAFAGEIVGAGSVTNRGTLRLGGAAQFDFTGAFVNEGVLDVLDWSGTLPPGFVNTGTILDRRAVTVTGAARSGNDFLVSTFGWAGRSFQLQYAGSLSGPWQDVGAPQPGDGSVLNFIHQGGSTNGSGFYRIRVW